MATMNEQESEKHKRIKDLKGIKSYFLYDMFIDN